jgi:hypothetical protein
VEDSEVEAELQEEQEVDCVGEKSNLGLQQCAGSSRDAHRFTGHERDQRKHEALTIDNTLDTLVNTVMNLRVP